MKPMRPHVVMVTVPGPSMIAPQRHLTWTFMTNSGFAAVRQPAAQGSPATGIGLILRRRIP
jgi:hypothetical protein